MKMKWVGKTIASVFNLTQSLSSHSEGDCERKVVT